MRIVRAWVVATILVGGIVVVSAQTRPSFEVASIKRNQSLDGGSWVIQPGGRFRGTNAPVFWLIMNAFGEFQRTVLESQVVGAPDWLWSEHYDIIAKTGEDIAKMPQADQFRAIPKLLQSLLEDRFKLRAHRETRRLPIYVLTFARKDHALGPKLTRSTLDCTKETTKCGFNGARGHMMGGSLQMLTIANVLQSLSERVVVDKTGLDGRFDVDLEYSPDQTATDKPSIFAAVQEQLGLKLESDTGPVDVVVIDHIERPTED
jgi:uncharacterized protein (TIGR03435 family)